MNLRRGILPPGIRLLLSALPLAAFAQPRDTGYEFSFRPGKFPELAPGFVQRYDHPCGEVVTARVRALPAFRDTSYQPDPAMEFDAAGKPVRQWPLPVDYIPKAVQGVELLIAFGSRGFWVSPEGNLRPDSLTRKLPDTQPLECTAPVVAGKSTDSRCTVFPDVDTGVPRRIGYVASCR
jgi:hypothetical protein